MNTEHRDNLPALQLVPPGNLLDKLVTAVIDGEKTATSRLVFMDEMTRTKREHPGDRSRLVDSSGRTAAIVEIIQVEELPLASVGDDIARGEGSWFANAAEWRSAHERYWSRFRDEIRMHLGEPKWELTDTTLVRVRHFRTVIPSS